MIECSPRIVLLVDGSVESITCAAIAMDRLEHAPKPVKIIPISFLDSEESECSAQRAEVIKRQFQYLGIVPTESDLNPARGIVGLVMAIEQAGPEGTVMWPRRCTADPEGIARTLGLVEHLTGLAHCAHPGATTEIDLPLLDLSPSQVLELGASLGAPLQAGWPCEADRAQPCQSCDPCQLWIEASRASGRPVPWFSELVAP